MKMDFKEKGHGLKAVSYHIATRRHDPENHDMNIHRDISEVLPTNII
jgi:hypothetical protein